jgi:hypothetical protein
LTSDDLKKKEIYVKSLKLLTKEILIHLIKNTKDITNLFRIYQTMFHKNYLDSNEILEVKKNK